MIDNIKLSKSCEECSFEEQQKCTKAFLKCDRKYFVHCNSSNCKLLKDLGI